jgi:hypothetical protein
MLAVKLLRAGVAQQHSLLLLAILPCLANNTQLYDKLAAAITRADVSCICNAIVVCSSSYKTAHWMLKL